MINTLKKKNTFKTALNVSVLNQGIESSSLKISRASTVLFVSFCRKKKHTTALNNLTVYQGAISSSSLNSFLITLRLLLSFFLEKVPNTKVFITMRSLTSQILSTFTQFLKFCKGVTIQSLRFNLRNLFFFKKKKKIKRWLVKKLASI